jgi:glycosyltransferase involved in cell wall biosynthesis
MHIFFVDRRGAKSIWELMGHIASLCLHSGAKVTFVIWDDSEQEYSEEIPAGVNAEVVRVPPKRHTHDVVLQHLAFARAFRRLLRKNRPDIVHTNFAVPSIVARLIATMEHVPVVVSTQHELYGSMSMYYRWGLRLTRRCCRAIVYVSNVVAHSFGVPIQQPNTDGYATGSRADIVIHNGVDLMKIRAAIRTVSARVPGRIVCAGRLVEVKGQHVLIEALGEAAASRPELHVRLIGAGPMERQLRARAAQRGISAKVEFLGWRSHEEVLREMASASVVVVPSDGSQEGYGLVVVEAVVCGAPLVLSDIPVFREVMRGVDHSHEFFPAGNTEALAKALRTELRPVNRDGQSKGEVAYSSDRMASSYLSLYKALRGEISNV